MAEKSFLWTTGGAGDGATEYTRTEWSIICQTLGAALAFEGVVRGYGGLLAPSSTGINNARIATGGALVDGKPGKDRHLFVPERGPVLCLVHPRACEHDRGQTR